jgi:hypothetical protein
MEPRYTISLASIRRSQLNGNTLIPWRGPFVNEEHYAKGMLKAPLQFPVKEILTWTETAALPLLPTEESGAVFLQLLKSPRLDLNQPTSWRARPYGEAHSAKCKDYLLAPGIADKHAWPVFKGESFDLESCETGEVYGYADPEVIGKWLEGARRRQVKGSAYAEFSRKWAQNPACAPWLHCRVVFRDVARATDTRTVIVSVIPPKVFLTDKAPYFLFPRGDVSDQLYLYGVLRSLPLDWYARRFVETGVKFYIVSGFPIPRPSSDSTLRNRIVMLAGRLTCRDNRFREWASTVGVECGRLEDDEKEDMVHELDAVVAHLYGLNEDQLRHIFETFHEGWDYSFRLERTMEHFRKLRFSV